MTEKVECNGTVSSVLYCGFYNPEDSPEMEDIANYVFALLHLRSSSDGFEIIKRQSILSDADTVSVDGTNVSLNARCQQFNITSALNVLKGDQLGVAMGSQCFARLCPIQVGLINTGCETQSLYEPDFIYSSTSKTSISMSSLSQVAVRVNIQVEVGENNK